jgi:hypothetical protein
VQAAASRCILEQQTFLIGEEQMTVQRSDWEDLTLQTAASLFTDWDGKFLTVKDKEKEWQTASDEECLRFLTAHYLNGRCGDWAYVLNKKTGWRILHMALPADNHHYWCETPEGLPVDASGVTTLDAIMNRYKLGKDPVITEVSPAELFTDDVDEERIIRFASLVMDKISFLAKILKRS